MADGYYGQPLLKPPVWTWEIPAYFFVGGAAGVAAVIAAVAAIAGTDAGLVRDARWVAATGAVISPVLLVSDLGRPSRFMSMLRVFKRQSPMSVGAWTLAVFLPATIASLVWGPGSAGSDAAWWMRLAGLTASVIGAATGLVLATYTGVLLGVTTVPVWAAHTRTLPLHFGASSLGAGVSILELFGHVTPALNALGIASAAGVTVAWIGLERDRRPVAKPLTSGPSGRLARAGDLLSGPLPLVLRLLAASSPFARLAAAAATITGSLVTRVGWIAAGKASVAGATILALMLAGTRPLAQARPPDLSPKAIAASAAAYVKAYREEFKYLLADEVYTQKVYNAAGTLVEERRLKGELYLTYFPADAEWLAVHDITEIDDRPIPGRDDLKRLIQQGDVRGAAMRVASRNASFNIGRLERNFNEPMLPLLLLEPKRMRHLAFERQRVVDAGDRTLVSLSYKEQDRPTLVRSKSGTPLYSTGAFVIDAATGRVERTEFTIKNKQVTSQLMTEYALEPRLKIWVPLIFREFYDSTRDGHREVIRCEATYTNYTRFEVTGRIVK